MGLDALGKWSLIDAFMLTLMMVRAPGPCPGATCPSAWRYPRSTPGVSWPYSGVH